jgi:hypothetical protein
MTDSVERCTAIFPGSQTIESNSRWTKPSRAANARAYVLFPEPELPKMRTFMQLNETQASYRHRKQAMLGMEEIVVIWKYECTAGRGYFHKIG